jgi:glycosyltransferase involved in cell wall biosynthesis
MSPLRVCFVGLDNLPVLFREYEHHRIGGEEVQQTLLARALARGGHSVSMVTGDFGQPDAETRDGVRVLRAYSAGEGLPVVRFVYPRWTKLRAALARADADVYYLSCASALVGQAAMWARAHGRRIVFRIASDTDCEPHRLLIRFWRDKKLYEYGLRRSSRILAQTVKQQELLRHNYQLPSTLASMLVESPKSMASFAARQIDVLWVSNIRGLKRPDVFIELVKRLGSCRAVMIGGTQPGSEALYDETKQLAAGVGNLEFMGAVPYHATNEVFDRARVFVNTSEIEGFPNSFLQAWTRGIPVVSFFDPDGVIAREGLGRTVTNIEEMTAAVSTLHSDAQLWQESSARCRAFMAAHFDEGRILAPYLEALSAEGARGIQQPAKSNA